MSGSRMSLVGSMLVGTSLLVAVLGSISSALIAAPGCARPPASSPAAAADQVVRGGTFSREKVLIAYYGAAMGEAQLRELHQKSDDAKQRKDDAEVARLEKVGSGMQDLAHERMEGKAELGEVLDAFRPFFAEVGEEAGVAIIIEKPLWTSSDADVELVDVSEALAAKIPQRAKLPKK